MKMFKEAVLQGRNHGRRFSIDMRWHIDKRPKPIIVFLHGFKGFKDWGTFPLIAEILSDAGFVVIKVNFSHNGVTPNDPVDFTDLGAFAENRFSYELDDVRDVIDFIHSSSFRVPAIEINTDRIHLVGHSRGGATAIIYAADDDRIHSVCGWAAVCNLEDRWPQEALEKWKAAGVTFVPNARTGQEMPLKYDLVEDYLEHQERLNVRQRLQEMNKPIMLIHGTEDETVPLEDTLKATESMTHVDLKIIEGANHVFGGGHPYDETELPVHSRELISETINFLRNND